MMKLFVAADHQGFELKERILQKLQTNVIPGIEVVDLGAKKHVETDDYPDFAKKLAKSIQNEPNSYGILICKSAIGMSIAANKYKNIYASICHNPAESRQDRIEHDSNVLVLSSATFSGFNSTNKAISTISNWLRPHQIAGRHLRRVQKIILEEKLESGSWATPLIIPAPLEYSTTQLEKKINIIQSISPFVHIDYVDKDFGEIGIQNKNIPTIPLEDILSVIKRSNRPTNLFALHLMTPESKIIFQLKQLNNTKGIRLVYVHLKTERITKEIAEKEWSFEIAYSIDLGDKPNRGILEEFNIVQIMTVKAGSQGQTFNANALDTINILNELKYKGEIHLDGGINQDSIGQINLTQIDVLNIGSTLLKELDTSDNLKGFKEYSTRYLNITEGIYNKL